MLEQIGTLVKGANVENIPTATVVEHALLTQGFSGVSKAPFPRLFRPQNRDSTWANLANAPK